MKQRTKPTLIVGIVSVWKRGDKWLLRYVDPFTRVDVRRVVKGIERKKVIEMATHWNDETMANKGFMPGKPQAIPTITEGITATINCSRGNDTTRKDMRDRANLFIDWLAENHASVRTWKDLKPTMLEEYLIDMERDGKAHNTITHRLAPVMMAWRRLHADYRDRVAAPPRLRRKAKPKAELDCLEPSEVAALLDWLRDNKRALWGMATLQALCGLRMMEAAALRVQDVDLEAGTIHVTSTEFHKVKTAESDRVVPLCDEALATLKVVISKLADRKIQPITGELFTNIGGDLWNRFTLGHHWRRAQLKAVKALENPRIASIPPHKLRSSFATMVARLGCPDRLIKSAMGHAATDMLGQHYRKVTIEEIKQSVSVPLNSWRVKGVWQISGISANSTLDGSVQIVQNQA